MFINLWKLCEFSYSISRYYCGSTRFFFIIIAILHFNTYAASDSDLIVVVCSEEHAQMNHCRHEHLVYTNSSESCSRRPWASIHGRADPNRSSNGLALTDMPTVASEPWQVSTNRPLLPLGLHLSTNLERDKGWDLPFIVPLQAGSWYCWGCPGQKSQETQLHCPQDTVNFTLLGPIYQEDYRLALYCYLSSHALIRPTKGEWISETKFHIFMWLSTEKPRS